MSSVAPPPPIVLSAAGASDLDEVMLVMVAAFPPDFGEGWTRSQCAGILPMSGVTLTLARDSASGLAQGFSLLRTVADEAELLLVGVTPARRRCGIGRALVDHFITHAKARGAVRLHLEVRDGNAAVGVYHAAGFLPAGRRSNYYRGRDSITYDALTLVYTISGS